MVSCFCIVVAIHISAYMFLVCDFMRFTDLLFRVTNIQIFFNVTGFAKFFLGEKKVRWEKNSELRTEEVCIFEGVELNMSPVY